MHRIQIRQSKKKGAANLYYQHFHHQNLAAKKTSFWRQNPGGPRRWLRGQSVVVSLVCCRDECRRRMVQGEFEVGGGTGGATGLPGPGITGHGGITGPSSKLPSPDSPVSDVNSILAGAHLQVRNIFFY